MTSKGRSVQITLPEWVWGRLATIADDRRTSISQLVQNAISDSLVNDDGQLGQLDKELRAARKEGWRAKPLKGSN